MERFSRLYALGAVLITILAGCEPVPAPKLAQTPDTAYQSSRPGAAQNGRPTLAPMLEAVLPAVVNISTTSAGNMRDSPMLKEPPSPEGSMSRAYRGTECHSRVSVPA